MVKYRNPEILQKKATQTQPLLTNNFEPKKQENRDKSSYDYCTQIFINVGVTILGKIKCQRTDGKKIN